MATTKCLHRLTSGSFCKRWAVHGSRFCSHHQSSMAHLQHDQALELHPLARLTTPEDVFDLLRETLNAARLGRVAPAQAHAVAHLAAEWRKTYEALLFRQRDTALHRQILPDLMVEETEAEAERAEAPHPLPVRVDQEAIFAHGSNEPITPPLRPPSDYPGWTERYGRRTGDRTPTAGEVPREALRPAASAQAEAPAPVETRPAARVPVPLRARSEPPAPGVPGAIPAVPPSNNGRRRDEQDGGSP